MKKTKILVLSIVLIIVSIIVLQCCDNDEYNAFVQQKLTEVSEYLSQKYNNANEFVLTEYSTMEGFSALYCMKDEPDFYFRVYYWVNKQQYADNYLQKILDREMDTIVRDRLNISNSSDIKDVGIGSMFGPPLDLTNRLYEYYKKLGREPRVQDIIGLEKFSHVTVYFNKDVVSESEKERINNLLADLPIERIDYRVRE